MKDLPNWIIGYLEDQVCPGCGAKIDPDFVTACGVAASAKDPAIEVCRIDYFCLICDRGFSLEINSLYSLADLADDIKKSKPVKKKSTKLPTSPPSCKGKSKISDAEVKAFSRMLRDADSWDDVLYGIGIRQEDIEEYNAFGKRVDAELDKINKPKPKTKPKAKKKKPKDDESEGGKGKKCTA